AAACRSAADSPGRAEDRAAVDDRLVCASGQRPFRALRSRRALTKWYSLKWSRAQPHALLARAAAAWRLYNWAIHSAGRHLCEGPDMQSTATSAVRAIVIGGLIAGTIDIGAAALISRVSPVLICHYIATGLLGKAALSTGAPAAYLGLILQWAMSIVIAAIYWFVTARLPRLREQWWLGGVLAGPIIYLVMNFLVMPFSAAPVTLHEVIAHFTLLKGAENLA